MYHIAFDEVLQKIEEIKEEILDLEVDEAEHSCSSNPYDDCACVEIRERLDNKHAALSELEVIARELSDQQNTHRDKQRYD